MVTTRKMVLGGRDSVRVCLAQLSPVFMDRNETIKRAVAAIGEAGKKGADLIVFPEAWIAGYPYWTEGWDSNLQNWIRGRISFFDEAVMVPSQATHDLGEAARKANIHVVIGCNEIDDRPAVRTIYNSLLFFDREGVIYGRHRKLMPTFTERIFWGAGDASDLGVYETDIGRIGGLICGENLMTPLRAAMIAMGEDIHIAVFPGSFALHNGPSLEEWSDDGSFWGHFVTRAHAIEGGCFVCSVSGILDAVDVPDDFPHKASMNTRYARGGSQIVSPLGIPLVTPVEGTQLIYADCQAWMIKAIKAIVDTAGHYSRPDVVRVMLAGPQGWRDAGERYRGGAIDPLRLDQIERKADEWGADMDDVKRIAESKAVLIHK